MTNRQAYAEDLTDLANDRSAVKFLCRKAVAGSRRLDKAQKRQLMAILVDAVDEAFWPDMQSVRDTIAEFDAGGADPYEPTAEELETSND